MLRSIKYLKWAIVTSSLIGSLAITPVYAVANSPQELKKLLAEKEVLRRAGEEQERKRREAREKKEDLLDPEGAVERKKTREATEAKQVADNKAKATK